MDMSMPQTLKGVTGFLRKSREELMITILFVALATE